MSVAGRFEILSPVFSGAVESSTARDAQTGETVLLHFVPADRTGSPAEVFRQLAPACPGKILASGVDAGRPFVVTDYPRDRKALLLWIRQLSRLEAPPKPAVAKPSARVAPPPPAAEAPAGATRMFDPAAIFGGSAPPPQPLEPNAPSADAAAGATRMFDPAAVFGPAAVRPTQTPAATAPAESAATRMFDPAAAFGAMPAAKPKETPEPPAAAAEGATRMFDPSALYGVSSSIPSDGLSTVKLPRAPDDDASSAQPESPSSGETRMFASQDLAGFFAGASAAGDSSTAHANDAKAENSKQPPPPKDRSR